MSELGELGRAQAPSATNTVARGAMAFFGTQPLTWAATLVSTILLPRYLGDNGLGQYAVLISVAAMAQTAATFGVPSYMTRRVATGSDRTADEAAAALTLVVGIALLTVASICVVLPALGFVLGDPVLLPVALAAIVLASAQAVLLSVLIGQERFARGAWLGAAGNIVAPFAGVAVVVAGGDVLALLVSHLVVGALSLLLTWAASGIALRRSALSPALWRSLLWGGWPFLSWNIAARIRSESDRIVLVVLASTTAVGWYAAAWRIVAIPLFIPALITTPLLPALSRTVRDRPAFRHVLRRSLHVALLLTVPLTGLIIALAPAIPSLLGWRAEFAASVPIMTILAAHQPILVTNMLLGTALTALHAERRWLAVGIAGALVNPVLNLAVIPIAHNVSQNAAIGAAIVVFATELVMLAGALRLLPRGMLDRSTFAMAARITLAGAALVAVGAVVRPTSLPLAVFAGMATYAAAIVALGVMRPTDMRAIAMLAWRSRSRAVAS